MMNHELKRFAEWLKSSKKSFSFIKEVCYLNYAKRPWFIMKPLLFLFLENQNLSLFSIKRKKKLD